MNFLQDKPFLSKLNHHKIKHYYASIDVLDFETEKTIQTFTGKVISGNMNIAANSPTRRTASFQVIFDADTYNITDIDNLIAIDKKIALSVGINNPFYNQYRDYGEQLWFKQGIFFITTASASISQNGRTISINLIDKMGGLNGVCGGTLPASVSFHDKIVYQDNGDQLIEYPLIKEIIYEAVTHFGNESPARVIIEDIPDVGSQVIRYTGSSPIKLLPRQSSGDSYARQLVFQAPAPDDAPGTEHYYQGDIIGYQETPLTYPGELVQKAGSTVTTVLDEIAKTLGNFEYFYDEYGDFHFRRIRDYQAISNTSLMDDNLEELYLPQYFNDEFLNEFSDTELVTQVSFQPKWDNIKNDFICWGTKNASNNSAGMVRYHLAIDDRPKDIPEAKGPLMPSLCHQAIYVVKDLQTLKVLRYQTTQDIAPTEKWEKYCESLNDHFDGKYPFDWREELYRMALLAYNTGTKASNYDEELMEEWRKIYDPESEDFRTRWEAHFGKATPWVGYNPDVILAPDKLVYWLDIIDSASPIGRYCIRRIGKRTVVQENSKTNEVFGLQIPPVIYLENNGDTEQMTKSADYYKGIGQDYTFVTPETMRMFSLKNTLGTCYDDIREMLNKHLLYNASVSLTTIPIFYLSVNTLTHLNFPDIGITGDFLMNSISWQIGQNAATMTIQMNEVMKLI